MRSMLLLAITVLVQPLATEPVRAQATASDVTFAVPLNLTNLSTDVTKARVACTLVIPVQQGLGGDRSGEVEVQVTNRQVVTTAQVTVAIPPVIAARFNDLQTMNYRCLLSLYSPSVGWSEDTAFVPNERSGSFRTTQPVSARINGQFPW